MANWTFLTHHAHALIELSQNPDLTLERLASNIGISTRATVTILNDLVEAGFVERERRGRRNHYVIHANQPLRHRSNAHHTVSELVSALTAVPVEAR